jgi:hypothetical protein
MCVSSVRHCFTARENKEVLTMKIFAGLVTLAALIFIILVMGMYSKAQAQNAQYCITVGAFKADISDRFKDLHMSEMGGSEAKAFISAYNDFPPVTTRFHADYIVAVRNDSKPNIAMVLFEHGCYIDTIFDGFYMKNVFALFSKTKQKETTMKPELVRLTEISSAVARGITALKALIAECEGHKAEVAALKAKAVDDQAVIDALTAALEAAIPDAGGSTGGVVG